MTPSPISESYAVAGQIEPDDIVAIRQAGYTTVICNRPDNEVPPASASKAIADACAEEGVHFVYNPLSHGTLSMDHVTTQRVAMESHGKPVLAYCASGHRSAVLWALASAGDLATDETLAATSRAGYPLDGLRSQIDALSTD